MRFGDVEVFNSYGGTARGSIQVDKATPEMRVMQGANTIHVSDRRRGRGGFRLFLKAWALNACEPGSAYVEHRGDRPGDCNLTDILQYRWSGSYP